MVVVVIKNVLTGFEFQVFHGVRPTGQRCPVWITLYRDWPPVPFWIDEAVGEMEFGCGH